jgi:hypothetical protein
MISSSAIPASGQPSMLRGASPQVSVVDRPTASRCRNGVGCKARTVGNVL